MCFWFSFTYLFQGEEILSQQTNDSRLQIMCFWFSFTYLFQGEEILSQQTNDSVNENGDDEESVLSEDSSNDEAEVFFYLIRLNGVYNFGNYSTK